MVLHQVFGVHNGKFLDDVRPLPIRASSDAKKSYAR